MDGTIYKITNIQNNKIYSLMGEKNHFYGKSHSKKTKRKLSELNMGKSLSDTTKEKLSKLTRQDVVEIKNLLNKGLLQKDIANAFSVSAGTIYRINSGKRWGHV